jgi:hypothetical protein
MTLRKNRIIRHWKLISIPVLTLIIITGIVVSQLQPSIRFSKSWISISNALIVDNQPMKQVVSAPSTILNSPSTTSGLWINPINAYSDGINYTSIISGTPSSSQIYSGYGFNLNGNIVNSVKVRYDVSSLGETTPTNQQRIPISDESNTGAFTVSPLWSKVDETTPVDTDYATGITNTGGRATFGFTAFSVPLDATITNVTVYYRMWASSTAASARACLKVGSTYYQGTQVATTTTYTTRSYAWPTNPAGGSWTPAIVNGLLAFGVTSTDYNPDVRFSMVYAQVNYTTAPGNFEQVRIDVSGDGGTTWTAQQITTTTGTETTYWYDVTTLIPWTSTNLTDTNFRVRVDAYTVGTASQVRLDWIPVEVIYEPDMLPTLDVRFEPSGTQIDNDGWLKIRLDFYPSPDDLSYVQNHIQVPIIPTGGYPGAVDGDGNPIDQNAYDAWLASLPTEWVTNPTLCHFLVVNPDITVAELDVLVKSLFPSNVTATIDNAMIQANSAHLISPYMRDKSVTTTVKAPIPDPGSKEIPLVDAVNARLSGYGLIGGVSSMSGEPIQPKSIDVGAAATNRLSAQDFVYSGTKYTQVTKDNPSNATGTLDTCEIWLSLVTGGTYTCDIWFGTFSVSGTTLTCRDSDSLGNVSTGSKQTFTGKSIDVVTDDLLGVSDKGGAISVQGRGDSTGGAGKWRITSEKIDPGDSGTFTSADGYIISIYATGTEAATFAITNAPGTTIALGVVAVSSTYYAYGSAPSNPVTDGECSQTLTETGGSACDIDIHGHNSTGGSGMSIVSGAPGANEFRITTYKGGDNPASGLVITTSDQEFNDNLAASGHFHWDFKFETGSSFGYGNAQTTTLTVTARAHT